VGGIDRGIERGGAMSALEDRVALELRARPRIPAPTREYRFAAELVGGTGKGVRERLERAGLSDWRLDFAWPVEMIALEVEGGVWSRGRHVRPAGFLEDIRKYNSLAIEGWTLLRVTGDINADWLVYDFLESVEWGAE